MSGGLKLNARVNLLALHSMTDGTRTAELLIRLPSGELLSGMLANIVSSVPLDWIASRLPCDAEKLSAYLAGCHVSYDSAGSSPGVSGAANHVVDL